MSQTLVLWCTSCCWKLVLLFGPCWTGWWCLHCGLCCSFHRWTRHHVWPICQGIGPQCHPSSFGRCPGTFSVQRGHVGICTCQGGCWMLWGVMLPLLDAYWRRPCCHLPLRTWWLPWGHVSYLLEGWCFVVLMDDCLIQVLGVKAYS